MKLRFRQCPITQDSVKQRASPRGGWEAQGQDIEEFPYFKRWFEELGARPAVVRGMQAGSDLSIDYGSLSDDDKSRLQKLLYNQRARRAPEGGLL